MSIAPLSVACFVKTRAAWLGAPKKFIVGSGANFSGRQRSMISNTFGIAIIVIPVSGHHSIRKVERRIQILEIAYRSIDESVGTVLDPSMQFDTTLMAHNSTPSSSTSIPPLAALTGRTGIVEDLCQTAIEPTPSERYDAEERNFCNSMQSINKARADIVSFDANHTLTVCLRRPLQQDSATSFADGDFADIWVAKKHRWLGTFRVIYDTGRSVLVGNLGSISNHPKAWVRLRRRGRDLMSPLGRAERNPPHRTILPLKIWHRVPMNHRRRTRLMKNVDHITLAR